MTPDTLLITVGDREDLREDALEVAHAIDDAESPDDLDLSDRLEGRSVLQFGSYDDLVDNLTPLRLDLLQAIAEHEPQSMREAARLVERDVSDVHSDLQRLEVLDILDLEEGGPGGAMQPVVPFERIEMHIDYPLVDDVGGDEARAGAD